MEEQYTSDMIEPYYDDFYKNPFRRTYENLIFRILVKIDLYIQYYTSDGYFQRFVEKLIIKREASLHKQRKIQEIRNTVHSYRTAFQRFNTPSRPTCFDQTPAGDLIRARINCKTNRDIVIKN
jgi:hypothetical protein